MHSDLKKLVHTWFAEVWNARRVSTIDTMMVPECLVQLEGVDGGITRDALKAYCSALLNDGTGAS